MAREFYAQKSKLKHGLLIAGLIAIMGLWVLLFAGETIPDSQLVGGVNLVLALGIALYAWRSSQTAGATLTIDEAGVWYREWNFKLPWSQVADIYAKGSRLNPMIALQLRDSAAFLHSLPQDKARRLKAGRYFKDPQLLLPNSCTDTPFSEVLAVLQACQEEARRGDSEA